MTRRDQSFTRLLYFVSIRCTIQLLTHDLIWRKTDKSSLNPVRRRKKERKKEQNKFVNRNFGLTYTFFRSSLSQSQFERTVASRTQFVLTFFLLLLITSVVNQHCNYQYRSVNEDCGGILRQGQLHGEHMCVDLNNSSHESRKTTSTSNVRALLFPFGLRPRHTYERDTTMKKQLEGENCSSLLLQRMKERKKKKKKKRVRRKEKKKGRKKNSSTVVEQYL